MSYIVPCDLREATDHEIGKKSDGPWKIGVGRFSTDLKKNRRAMENWRRTIFHGPSLRGCHTVGVENLASFLKSFSYFSQRRNKMSKSNTRNHLLVLGPLRNFRALRILSDRS